MRTESEARRHKEQNGRRFREATLDYQLYLHLIDGSRAVTTLREVDRLYFVGQTFNDSASPPKRWEVTEVVDTVPPTMTWTEIVRHRSS